jgi:3-oxoacyl-[acyl-carrier-protein] synthase-3
VRRSRIIGTGSYLPSRVVGNEEVSRSLRLNAEAIERRTGIRTRRWAAEDEASSDLAEQAARRACEAAGVSPDSVDAILLSTTSPDMTFPSTACLLQQRLHAPRAAAFDVAASCSGFLYGLSMADAFLRSGQYRRCLVVAAEVKSRFLDPSDEATAILFGDGAGAVVLGAADKAGIISSHLHADGQYKDLLTVHAGISQGYDRVTQRRAHMSMEGGEVFKVAVNTLGKIVDETLESNQLQKSDVKWLVPHQANIRIIAATAKKLGLPMERVVLTVDRHGNTSAASIPLAFDEAVRDGRIQRGDMVLMEAFGGGFTWGSVLLKY